DDFRVLVVDEAAIGADETLPVVAVRDERHAGTAQIAARHRRECGRAAGSPPGAVAAAPTPRAGLPPRSAGWGRRLRWGSTSLPRASLPGVTRRAGSAGSTRWPIGMTFCATGDGGWVTGPGAIGMADSCETIRDDVTDPLTNR